MASEKYISDVEAAVVAGETLAKVEDRILFPQLADLDAVPLAIIRDSDRVHVLKDLVLASDERRPRPRYRSGESNHYELDSFLEHVNRYKTVDSVAWADQNGLRVLCVYDADPSTVVQENPTAVLAGWGRHRSVYEATASDEWKRWTSVEDKYLSQDDFAELIEESERLINGKGGLPKAVELLEMARDLRVYTKGTFERKIDPTTGQYAMVCKHEHESHSTSIHPKFQLGLRVFEGGVAYAVDVAVKFRVQTDGRPTFSVAMLRRSEIVRDAFNEIRTAVHEKTGIPVFAGVPGDE